MLHVIKKDSGNKNAILLYTFQIVFALDFTWPEFQVLTSQPDIQEIPFHDPSLYLHLYIIVPTGTLLSWNDFCCPHHMSGSFQSLLLKSIISSFLYLPTVSLVPSNQREIHFSAFLQWFLLQMMLIKVLWLKAQILTWCEARLHDLLVRCLWGGVISFSKYSFLICKI